MQTSGVLNCGSVYILNYKILLLKTFYASIELKLLRGAPFSPYFVNLVAKFLLPRVISLRAYLKENLVPRTFSG